MKVGDRVKIRSSDFPIDIYGGETYYWAVGLVGRLHVMGPASDYLLLNTPTDRTVYYVLLDREDCIRYQCGTIWCYDVMPVIDYADIVLPKELFEI